MVQFCSVLFIFNRLNHFLSFFFLTFVAFFFVTLASQLNAGEVDRVIFFFFCIGVFPSLGMGHRDKVVQV